MSSRALVRTLFLCSTFCALLCGFICCTSQSGFQSSSYADLQLLSTGTPTTTISPGATTTTLADSAPPSAQFLVVFGIMQTNCVSCHSAFAVYKEQDYITNNYVVPQNPAASELYNYLQNSGVPGPNNMPQAGSLTSDQIKAFSTWINAVQAIYNGDTGTSRTNAALAVIQKNCSSCHTSTRVATSDLFRGATVPAFANFTTDGEFVTSGLVDVGNPSTSWIIEVLRGYGTVATMPANGMTITAPDEQALATWITEMDQ